MPAESNSYNILWLESTDSTNSEARRRLDSLQNFCCIASKCQNVGRGQADHVWISDPGKNLTFSIVFKPDNLTAGDEQSISWAVTTGILDYLADKEVAARIKWPNDIWVRNLKICGILVENILEGKFVRGSIIGIGLNLNQKQWPSELPNPVSLAQLTGKDYDPQFELEILMDKICRRLVLLESADGRNSLQGEFENKVFRIV